MPKKKIICTQASANYEKVVVFEPNLPMIPDNYDRIILNEIEAFEKKGVKLTTEKIGNKLKKGQSTISVRIKKLSEAEYVEIKGHNKYLRPKGKSILNIMNNLAGKCIEPFNEEKLEKKDKI